MLEGIKEDFFAIQRNDPAARTFLEVVLCYPGFQALCIHRMAHTLWQFRWFKLSARILSQFARFLTGVEIHPGAVIGRGVFIDHGMGVVIGETASVGDYVTMFHGVTLGGTGKNIGKRHPTVGSYSEIGAHVVILGPVIIGERVKIGAGAVVLEDIPDKATVIGVPPAQRIIMRDL